ncbi:lytic transglycosylase domain-containing protein [Kibdelosporangium phytohabitans]|uniref:lytic transglycosylase domain-containing protein n=1 Tax=Kibdelosporangium phytohabitans TaxID=860235 RepID=UPI00178A712A|nr:hypothetical protein [Kibdelosporangium phytohabitans]MBE1467718.1 hypothetical protein [Kibdelosporangium phytohabitans]
MLRYLRRRRGLAAVTAALLLVPAALAGDAVSGWSAEDKSITPLANGLGRGFFGIDLEDLGASGQLPEVDGLSSELMRVIGDPDGLASAGDPINTPSGPLGIPGSALQAYKKAEFLLATQQPTCRMHWSLLASIGRIESNHGRGGAVDAKGNTLEKILGPVLNGVGFAAIQDTDRGALDDDTQWDRAVGPMQFIPSTWAGYAADGNGDNVKSPHNFYDASLAAGKYLCSGGLDMSNDQQRGIAVFRYNHSESYVRTVLLWAKAYEAGVSTIPDGTGVTTGNNTNPNAQAAPAQTPIATTPAPPPERRVATPARRTRRPATTRRSRRSRRRVRRAHRRRTHHRTRRPTLLRTPRPTRRPTLLRTRRPTRRRIRRPTRLRSRLRRVRPTSPRRVRRPRVLRRNRPSSRRPARPRARSRPCKLMACQGLLPSTVGLTRSACSSRT